MNQMDSPVQVLIPLQQWGKAQYNQWRRQWEQLNDFITPRICALLCRSAAAGILSFLLDGAFVFILQGFFISIGVIEQEKNLLPLWYPQTLLNTSLLLILFGTFRAVTSILKLYLPAKISHTFMNVHRKRLMKLSLEKDHDRSPEEILSVFSESTRDAGRFLHQVSLCINSGTSLFLLSILALFIAPKPFFISFLCFAAYFPISKSVWARYELTGWPSVAHWEGANRILYLGIHNNFLLRAYALLQNEVSRAIRKIDAFEQEHCHANLYYSLLKSLPGLFGIGVIVLITFISTRYLNIPGIRLISYFYILIRIANGLSDISSTRAEILFKWPSFERLRALEEKFFAHANFFSYPLTKTIEMNLFSHPSLSFHQVAFHYPERPLLFEGLNLTLNCGDTLIVKGRSGMGKSTFAALLMGLLQPTKGTITLNQLPLSQVYYSLSQSIGYATTNPFVCSGSIADFLSYGLTYQPSTLELRKALEVVSLDRDIAELLNGKDLLEANAQLSTGQIQRLALARALLRNPRILILDEATSNLDFETEMRVLENIRTIYSIPITVIITHRDSCDSLATQRLVLNSSPS